MPRRNANGLINEPAGDGAIGITLGSEGDEANEPVARFKQFAGSVARRRIRRARVSLPLAPVRYRGAWG